MIVIVVIIDDTAAVVVVVVPATVHCDGSIVVLVVLVTNTVLQSFTLPRWSLLSYAAIFADGQLFRVTR